MKQKSAFSAPVLAVYSVGIISIFTLSMLLLLANPEEKVTSFNSTKSISALGYAGAYALLKRMGTSVDRSFINKIIAPEKNGVLIKAEPPQGWMWKKDTHVANNIIVVLPKREAAGPLLRGAWINRVRLIPAETVSHIAQEINAGIKVVKVPVPSEWGTNRLGIKPSFVDTAQLITGEALTPVVGSADGMLIGEVYSRGNRIWIVSDPDILQNHGLTEGQNAALFMAMLRNIGGINAKVVFDEAIHGIAAPPNKRLRQIIEFPNIIVLVLMLCAAILLVWATVNRFGRPRNVPQSFEFGKDRLINITADLLDRAGCQSVILRRYVVATIRDVGQTFHAPSNLGVEALASWLDKIGNGRGVSLQAAEILEKCSGEGSSRARLRILADAAGDIHTWKEKMINGRSAHSSRR